MFSPKNFDHITSTIVLRSEVLTFKTLNVHSGVYTTPKINNIKTTKIA